jgi:hypothetical protein
MVPNRLPLLLRLLLLVLQFQPQILQQHRVVLLLFAPPLLLPDQLVALLLLLTSVALVQGPHTWHSSPLPLLLALLQLLQLHIPLFLLLPPLLLLLKRTALLDIPLLLPLLLLLVLLVPKALSTSPPPSVQQPTAPAQSPRTSKYSAALSSYLPSRCQPLT